MRQHGKHYVHAIAMDNERVEDRVIKKIKPELRRESTNGSQRRDSEGGTGVVSTQTLGLNSHDIGSERWCGTRN